MSDQLSSAMLAKLKELNAPPGAPQPVDAVDKAENRLNTEKSDTARAMRVGLWALGIGFGGFLLWAGLAPLDEGVPSPAMVTIDTKRKPVQHQTGGIIKEVLVGEGTVVKAGQTLIRLDDAVAEATHQASRQRYLALRAMEGRLLAEQANRSSIEFHKDLVEAAKSDPVIARHVQNQEQLFLTRKAAVAADQQSMAEAFRVRKACSSPTPACWKGARPNCACSTRNWSIQGDWSATAMPRATGSSSWSGRWPTRPWPLPTFAATRSGRRARSRKSASACWHGARTFAGKWKQALRM
jgi:hypothetical protein